MHGPSIRAPQYIRQMLITIKWEIDDDTIIMRELNTTLKTSGQIMQTEN